MKHRRPSKEAIVRDHLLGGYIHFVIFCQKWYFPHNLISNQDYRRRRRGRGRGSSKKRNYFKEVSASPFSGTISVLCSFTDITTHMTYSFTSHPKDEAIMVKCLAQGQAGIRTHILTTPELESNALDRSAIL